MTTALSDAEDHPGGFPKESFVLRNYTMECDLQNENLFPINKFVTFQSRSRAALRAYALIEPALLLVSRIITQHPHSFSIFIQRRDARHEDVFLDTDSELELPDQDVIDHVKRYIPDIEFDPDMAPDSSSFAQTNLRPQSTRDIITIDYNLIQLLTRPTAYDTQKLAALFFFTVLLGHEMAHVLEFRCVHAGHLRDDGEPFKTPPGITCREAGTAWELRTFGGQISPVCQPEGSIPGICGICIKSSSWNFNMMKLNESWIQRLFREAHWVDNAQHQHPILRPPIDIFARYAFLEDELDEAQARSPMKLKARNKDVQVETGSPRRKSRFYRYPSIINTCGGKNVRMSE